jgi:hypothetical protein
MTITRDIVIDLLPVYESGEASADTRALVDDFLARDTEFARIVRAARHRPAPPATTAAPGAEVERTAVNRTLKAIRRKSWTFGLAIFFTLLPFTIAFSGGDVLIFLWRDMPAFRLSLVVAAALWFSYWRQSQAFRKAGW